MENLIKLIIGISFLILVVFVEAFVLNKIYYWFIFDYIKIALPITAFIGISFIFGILNMKSIDIKNSQDSDITDSITYSITAVILTLTMLGVAYIIHISL